MFDNIGDKIKAMAMILCGVGIVASVILGVSLFDESFGVGAGTIVLGALASWVGSFCLYGFGELIEETTRNREINAELLKYMKGKNSSEDSQIENAFKRAASIGSYKIPGMQSASADSWRCQKCNSINHRTQQYCANCGEYK